MAKQPQTTNSWTLEHNGKSIVIPFKPLTGKAKKAVIGALQKTQTQADIIQKLLTVLPTDGSITEESIGEHIRQAIADGRITASEVLQLRHSDLNNASLELDTVYEILHIGSDCSNIENGNEIEQRIIEQDIPIEVAQDMADRFCQVCGLRLTRLQ